MTTIPFGAYSSTNNSHNNNRDRCTLNKKGISSGKSFHFHTHANNNDNNHSSNNNKRNTKIQ